MRKRYRVWYRIAIICWLFIMGTINVLSLTMSHASAFDFAERAVVIMLVGIFSLYSISYYFDEL